MHPCYVRNALNDWETLAFVAYEGYEKAYEDKIQLAPIYFKYLSHIMCHTLS